MAGRAKKPSKLEKDLDEVRLAARAPESPESRQRLVKALASSHGMVVERAARLVKERALDGYTSELIAAWPRMVEGGAKSDPGCKAKVAVLEALDGAEWMDTEPFLAAARSQQLEAAWGPPVDTASGVRTRALLALARQGWHDLPLLACERFADELAPVRAAAADALTGFGERGNAGPLLMKLEAGDEDPMVTLACMSGLLTLAPDWGLTVLVPMLRDDDAVRRELAALALGQSQRPDVVEPLVEALGDCAGASQREPLLRALGLHRSDRAAEVLLDRVATAPMADAELALSALAARRFDPGMREKLETAAAKNDRADLAEALTKALKD